MYPKGSVTISMTINPGDVMTAEVNYGSNKFTLSITDTTTGKKYSTTQSASGAQRSSAEWIAEAPSSNSGVLPLANFGTVYFTGAAATLNGHTGAINDTAWQSVPINMINSSGAVIAQTSVLPSDGKSFSVAWQGSGSSMAKGAAASARLTDAAMASYVLYQHPSQPDDSKDKPSSAISAVDLALLDLAI
jgi:hypothetical protein